TIPGLPGMVATFKDFKTSAEVPDFLQALEEPDLRNPGTIVQMNLRLSESLVPDRVSLTHWPGHEKLNAFQIPVEDIGNDSAIVMYWNESDLLPNHSREMAFTYGLGNIARGKEGKLGITVSTPLVVGRDFDVIAYVNEPV